MHGQCKQRADAIDSIASSYLFAEHKGKYKLQQGAKVVEAERANSQLVVHTMCFVSIVANEKAAWADTTFLQFIEGLTVCKRKLAHYLAAGGKT